MYTPLYIKTNNSLLTSMIKIDELVKFAKKNNIKALTITDNKIFSLSIILVLLFIQQSLSWSNLHNLKTLFLDITTRILGKEGWINSYW